MSKTPRAHYEGDPTLLRVMVRPQWILALVLALAVAAGFAWLGQWQLSHAITVESNDAPDSEIPRPITEVTAAGESVKDTAAGMVLTVSGAFVPGDFGVVEQRSNHGHDDGAWVVGHLATDSGQLAVAVGWAPDVAAAEQARAMIAADPALAAADFNGAGRYMPSDGAVAPRPNEDPWRVGSMSTAQQVNLWEPFDGAAYAGYLVLHPGSAFDVATLGELGLTAIESVPPLPAETISWLNLFYAVEWVVFAGFAVYFWYRLTRDAWEKEHELKLLNSASRSL